ncbi:MAG: MraY family glycosyltransferase [Candidatus Omnitrophota bacterium]
MLNCRILNLIFIFSCAFILAVFLTSFLRRFSLKHNLFIRKKGVPYIGGIGFSLAFILCLYLSFIIRGVILPFQFLWIIIFSFILLAIGFVDDLKEFSLKTKVAAQLAFIFLFLIFAKKIQIYFLPGWANYIVSFLWIAGITNAFNHLDVADGACGGISLIISLAFLVIFLKTASFLAFVFAGLSGALFAFMFFNLPRLEHRGRPKAKVFMGNSGSHFLGFLFAALSIYGDYAVLRSPWALLIPVLVLGLPIIDTLYLITARALKKVSPLRKSNDHIILKFLSQGYSQKKMLAGIYFIAVLWPLSGVFLLNGISAGFWILLSSSLLATILMIIGAGRGRACRCQS